MTAAFTQIIAPFTPAQVASLNSYQGAGRSHPFTCGESDCRFLTSQRPLLAEPGGWRCSACGWTQNWAWAFMTDDTWRQPGPWSQIVFTGVHGNVTVS